jgi:hypothetical protein
VTRSVTRTVVLPPPVPFDAPLALGPGERQLVYSAITRRDLYYPAPAYPAPAYPAPGYPPVVAETDYPLRAIYPDNSYAYGDYPYRDYAYRAPGYYNNHYVYKWDGVPLVIGGHMPPSVALYGVPDWLVARVPQAAPYSFARLDDRVYLVDPATSIIVAEIAP